MTATRIRSTLAALLTALLTSTACAGAPPSPEDPGEPPIRAELAAMAKNLTIQGFDYCSPFNDQDFDGWAIRVALPTPVPDGCTWRGQDVNAGLTLETGRTLVDISSDPAYRPGVRDIYALLLPLNWRTASSNTTPPATGPSASAAQPPTGSSTSTPRSPPATTNPASASATDPAGTPARSPNGSS